MRCYRCGSFLYENDYCAECGADVSMYKKIVKKSNELYNTGLEYARARNLTGAIRCLEVSIKMFKANINARNLLGLIYVETGEYTKGLVQWIISKSQQSENNLADYFLDALQNNRQFVNKMNSTIRKYNKAVTYVKQENYDLAEIQLKKLLNDNKNLVKGHQLLALLFMKKEKYAEARAALAKAQRIDNGNPTTLRYIAAVEAEIKNEEKSLTPTELRTKRAADAKAAEDKEPLSGDDVIIPKSPYKEHNPTTMAILYIIIGALVGAAIIFFVVVPARTKTLQNEAQIAQAELTAEIESLEAELESAAEEVENAEAEAQDAQDEADSSNTSYEIISAELEAYEALVTAYAALEEGDMDAAAEAIESVGELVVDVSEMSETFQNSYNTFIDAQASTVLANNISAGIAAYNSEEYQECVDYLLPVYETGYVTQDVLYYLGHAYSKLQDKSNTLKYLYEYQETYPEGAYISIVNTIVDSWEAG